MSSIAAVIYSLFRLPLLLHCTLFYALIAHSNLSVSFPFSLLSLLLLRHVAEQGKSQHCFRRESLVLSAVTWEERSQLAKKSLREGEVAGKGRRHDERRRGKVNKRETTVHALICRRSLLSFSKFLLVL